MLRGGIMTDMRVGLTYADVLLVPKKTPLNSRSEADLKSRWTKNITLNIPLVSANMASVTEHKMAIAMAREGGLGVIHQFCSVEEQIEEVKRVKKSTSFIVEDPLAISPHVTLQNAIEFMKANDVTSLLVVEEGKLIGILTSRDYEFEKNYEKTVSELMTKKLITADANISMDDAKKLLYAHRIEKLPLVKDGKIHGLITSQDIRKLEKWPHACRDEKGRLRVGAAVGVKDTIERAKALIDAGADVIILDVAHAHSDFVIQRLKELKSTFTIDVMVGNIATAEAAEDLIKAGADGLKVGIGPSPVCTTRIMSGAGVPQLTAVMEVAKIAKKYNIPVTADGGMLYPGDVAKAIAAGATTIFSGSLFAGTDEAPGMIVTKDGKRYKRYFGSASYDSNHERKERMEGKRVKEKLNVFVEGISTLVDYKGPVSEVINNLAKGLKSGMSYCGAYNIEQLHKNAEFIRITPSGWHESLGRGNKISE
jgi:IMP dehydrogenase